MACHEPEGRRPMRGTIATIFAYAGLIGSFLLAVYWAYWIWQFDWGVSTRGRALMFLAMAFGAIFVFLAGYFATLYASAAIGGDS
jgi:O-antigen/teichoic acid export membrane protein